VAGLPKAVPRWVAWDTVQQNHPMGVVVAAVVVQAWEGGDGEVGFWALKTMAFLSRPRLLCSSPYCQVELGYSV